MTKETNKQKVYFNPGQMESLFLGANSETFVASRRFGKSDGIIAPRMLRNAQWMPRSAGAIYAATFQQALSRTIPAAIAALARWGYKNEVHFFIGRKAPKASGFELPFIEPQSWDHVIHWYNGRIQHILSQDVKFSANSLTLDDLMIDEGRSINQDKLFNDAVPAVSGMIGHYKNIPWHKGITIVSDMPQGKQGEWILNRKNLMDLDLIRTIKATITEIVRLKSGTNITKEKELRHHRSMLMYLRRYAHFYKEFDSIDNLELLGEAYIRKMKRELTPLIFQTSIMNKRITKLVGGFYANLSEKIHYYDSFDNAWINNQRNDHGSIDLSQINGNHYFQDADINRNDVLSVAFDYNANINWIVTGQQEENQMKTLSSMFVKHDRKLREVVNDWCDYYRFHQVKTVVYYYDETALQGAYASDSETFADMVQDEFHKRGWICKAMYIGKPMKHMLKHQYINDALMGAKYLFPTFNRSRNEFLLPAMLQTGVKVGRNGFEKDKSGEKLAEVEDDPLELRTDGTDAWDTLFIGMNFYPFQGSGLSNFGSVFM